MTDLPWQYWHEQIWTLHTDWKIFHYGFRKKKKKNRKNAFRSEHSRFGLQRVWLRKDMKEIECEISKLLSNLRFWLFVLLTMINKRNSNRCTMHIEIVAVKWEFIEVTIIQFKFGKFCNWTWNRKNVGHKLISYYYSTHMHQLKCWKDSKIEDPPKYATKSMDDFKLDFVHKIWMETGVHSMANGNHNTNITINCGLVLLVCYYQFEIIIQRSWFVIHNLNWFI